MNKFRKIKKKIKIISNLFSTKEEGIFKNKHFQIDIYCHFKKYIEMTISGEDYIYDFIEIDRGKILDKEYYISSIYLPKKQQKQLIALLNKIIKIKRRKNENRE